MAPDPVALQLDREALEGGHDHQREDMGYSKKY